VSQQVETAQYLPPDVAQTLSGELVCYGRSVVGSEWDAIDAGTFNGEINPWGVEMFRTMAAVQPKTATEQSAYDRWMDQSTARQQARNDRLHGAEGIIPAPLWLVLLAICGVIFAYMLFFADRAEGLATQAMLMGSVTVVIALLMLLLVSFDHPHGSGVGRLQPTAMERTLGMINDEFDAAGLSVTPPCDASGNPS
jgi:hypothetical protein